MIKNEPTHSPPRLPSQQMPVSEPYLPRAPASPVAKWPRISEDADKLKPRGMARSISACQRCRSRKIRCDHKFPTCSACSKSGAECIGIDAATGREVPRSYVSHLEDQVAFLELELQKLKANRVNGSSPTSSLTPVDSGFVAVNSGPMILPSVLPTAGSGPPSATASDSRSPAVMRPPTTPGSSTSHLVTSALRSPAVSVASSTGDDATMVDNVMSSVDMVTAKTPAHERSATPGSKPKRHSPYLGASSGLSFARILFTVVKTNSQEASRVDSSLGGSSSHIDRSKTPSVSASRRALNVEPANLPPKHVAERLLSAFFSQANPQMPIMHREEFLTKYYEPVYGKLSEGVSLASDRTFIGVERAPADESATAPPPRTNCSDTTLYFLHIIFAIATSIHQQKYPVEISESYRVAASKYSAEVYSSPNRSLALQSLLLLALYSIMRPAIPGVWYILGSAMRLCIDLGLHNEERRSASSFSFSSGADQPAAELSPIELDMRRRLFWCTYALDRQVCVYLGRPVGFPEHCIRVQFPVELDDTFLTPGTQGALLDQKLDRANMPSYKHVSIAFFKIRIIQAEVQRMLYDCAELPRQYSSLQEWKFATNKKLDDWLVECPKPELMNCNFNQVFFELNYHQAKLLLNGISPATSASEPSPDEYRILWEAGSNIIKKYLELHDQLFINYSWVAVHNLFMAGTSYLYALYHSPEVRDASTMDEIAFNTSACVQVLSSLTDRCDAAVDCRDAFELLSAAIVKLWYDERELSLPQEPVEGAIPVKDGNSFDPVQDVRRTATPGDGTGSTGQPLSFSSLGSMPNWNEGLDDFFQEALHVDSALLFPDLGGAGGAPGRESSQSQSIFDMINEVPLPRIWNQYFNSSSGTVSW